MPHQEARITSADLKTYGGIIETSPGFVKIAAVTPRAIQLSAEGRKSTSKRWERILFHCWVLGLRDL
jgi:hypothetical protein